MQLSNIKKLELEALGLATFLHILALLLYGAFAIAPEAAPIDNSRMIKINLGGLEPEISGLEPMPIIPESEEGSTKTPSMPNSMPTAEEQIIPVDIEPVAAEKNKTNLADTDGPDAPIEQSKAAKSYLSRLQNAVQQNSNMPAEAVKKKLRGKAVIRLEFGRDGKIINYSLKEATGQKILDNAALKTAAKLKETSFPPAPEDFYPGSETLTFDFGIDYEPTKQ